MSQDLIEHISKKRDELAQASINLKKHFVGMDDIIDRIVKDIETWYTMPSLLSRPTIICLWGLTGVGKTDLVRRLVRELSMYDRYCEIEMSNKSITNYPWANSISNVLRDHSGIGDGDHGIVLLDEIQNYRTIDETGREIRDLKIKDIWTLLSDGRLPTKNDIEYLMGLIWDTDDKRQKKYNEPWEEENNIIDSKSYNSLLHFKKLLKLEEPLEEIRDWTPEKRKETIKRKVADQSIYEESDYSKCLIFISGNLDEAYPFAKAAEESDISADLFYERSLRINLIDVKTALKRRFRPEQIARLGNNHVIYPSLSSNTYRTIIERRKKSIVGRVMEQYKINVDIEDSIDELVYNNGVFPTQGTRPVFSTISEIIEGPIPKLVLECLKAKSYNIRMFYEDGHICGDIGTGDLIKVKYIGVLDMLKGRRENERDTRISTAIHEAGHAVTYAVLFGWCPPQIVSITSSSSTAGFIYCHSHCGSRELSEKEIAVAMAGTEAEKMVFGESWVKTGCRSDLAKATELASVMVRKAGMSSYSSLVGLGGNGHEDDLNFDIDGTNVLVEQIVAKNRTVAAQTLDQHKSLFVEVADILIAQQEIPSEQFCEICKKYGLDIEIKSSEEVFSNQYEKAFNYFRHRHQSS